MNYREQYKKKTGEEALGDEGQIHHCKPFFADNYVLWLEELAMTQAIKLLLPKTKRQIKINKGNHG